MSIKTIAIAFLLLVSFAGIGLLIAVDKLPSHAHEKFQSQIRALGFTDLTLPAPEKRLSAIRYSNIELDAEGRSVIDTLTVHYGIFDMLFGEKIRRVDIGNFYLSGEINTDGKLSLSGLPNPAALMNLHKSRIQNINLKNMTLSVLTAQLGGIRAAFNIQILNSADEMSWTGNFESVQSQLELIAKITGAMQSDSEWQTDIEIENAKIERDIGKITRMSGMMSLYGNGFDITRITSDMKAGGMTLMDLPWQNVSVSLNGIPAQLNTFISAESIGINGLELGFEGLLKNKTYAWNARLYAPNIQTAIEYLSLQKNFIIPKTLAGDIKTKDEIELEFKRRDNAFVLDIKDAATNTPLKAFTLEQKPDL